MWWSSCYHMMIIISIKQKTHAIFSCPPEKRGTVGCPKKHLANDFYRTQVNLGSDLWVRMSVRPTPLWNLTDVTLVDEDTNSILTDNANRAIQANALQCGNAVNQYAGQLCEQCKWCHLMTKFWTNASCAICWPNFLLMQVAPSGGQICN